MKGSEAQLRAASAALRRKPLFYEVVEDRPPGRFESVTGARFARCIAIQLLLPFPSQPAKAHADT